MTTTMTMIEKDDDDNDEMADEANEKDDNASVIEGPVIEGPGILRNQQ